MSEHASTGKPLPTIWRVPDELWEKIEPILAECDPPKSTGRRRIDQRAALDAIIFRLRSGCQWNHLPKEFPDDSSVHRTFQRWIELGVLDRIWAASVQECEELGGVSWEWQAADGGRWARPVWGGPRRPRSHRQSQERGEAEPPGRGRRRTTGGSGGRGERARR
jgi:transposase